LICENLVGIALRKKKVIHNPDPFSCCGCLVEGCIWGVCLYRNRNLKKFFKAAWYFLLFHILVFFMSQPLTFMFMITTTYILRTSYPDPYIVFTVCLLIYIVLFLIGYCKLGGNPRLPIILSLTCFIVNMSLMFLPGNEQFLTANLVVFGVSNAFTWALLLSARVRKFCKQKRRENKY
jgi:hypothetical protein